MFGFAKAAKEPLSDVKSAERWLASFPKLDPLAAHGELLKELAHAGETNEDRKPQHLEALFVADAYARDMRRVLTKQYIEHSSRSTKIEQQLWQGLFDLTQRFLGAYAACRRDLAGQEQDPRWQALRAELIAREMMHLAFDAKLRMFRYEQWIPGKWAELHQRFAEACAHKVERERLMLRGEPNALTIEHIYVVVLVLQLANAGNLNRGQIEWLATQLDDWCASLRLSVNSPAGTAFYVDLGQRTGLRRRGTTALEGEVLFVNTEPLHAVLQHYIMAIELKIRHEPLSSKTPRRVERLSLLTKIAAQVDVQFRPVERRGERTVAVGKVDAIASLNSICSFLRDDEPSSVPELDTVTTFKASVDYAIFGHLRNEQDRRKEVEQRRLNVFATPGGPWEMKDVSATGLRLTAPMQAACSVTLGMLVALRVQGDLVWTLGVVRRMRRVNADRAEIGLQRIADSMTVVEIAAHRQAGETEYAVEGDDSVPARDRRFKGLFLVLRQSNRKEAVQSLVVPAAEYAPTRRFRLTTSTSAYPIRCGTLLEHEPEWVWVAIEPLRLTQAQTEAAAAAGD